MTVRGLRLTGGDVAGDGGAIRSQETLFLEFSTVSHDSTDFVFAFRAGASVSAAQQAATEVAASTDWLFAENTLRERLSPGPRRSPSR